MCYNLGRGSCYCFKGNIAMSAAVELTLDQLATAIRQLIPGEGQTLLILLDSDLADEWQERRKLLCPEREAGTSSWRRR